MVVVVVVVELGVLMFGVAMILALRLSLTRHLQIKCECPSPEYCRQCLSALKPGADVLIMPETLPTDEDLSSGRVISLELVRCDARELVMHMRTMMMHTKALKFLSHYSSLRRMKTRMKTEHWEEAEKQLSKNHAAVEVTGHGGPSSGCYWKFRFWCVLGPG